MSLLSQIRWRPAIGDPSFMGWLTVIAYGGGAVVAALAAGCGAQRPGAEPRARQLWLAVAILMAFLCVNKQLDLQSLFTDIGRALARDEGWYDRRRAVQKWFVLGILFGSGGIGLWLAWRFRAFCRCHKLLVAGAFFLLTFIVVRAVSFHHVDAILHTELGGCRVNWILELTGIFLVTLAALRELRSGSSARFFSRRSARG